VRSNAGKPSGTSGYCRSIILTDAEEPSARNLPLHFEPRGVSVHVGPEYGWRWATLALVCVRPVVVQRGGRHSARRKAVSGLGCLVGGVPGRPPQYPCSTAEGHGADRQTLLLLAPPEPHFDVAGLWP